MDYQFKSDDEADMWLISDDPASDGWTVEVHAKGAWHTEPVSHAESDSDPPFFPGNGYRNARNAWLLRYVNSDYDGLRITEPDGAVTLLRDPDRPEAT